eukprot:GHRQ01026994.1.p5 GENE.GHRQ01026994.1~~GHRQ01026994.1.p5  ORF type:complete len:105 (+),score=24.58 GHRQ01026994.1:1035-1349(+)
MWCSCREEILKFETLLGLPGQQLCTASLHNSTEGARHAGLSAERAAAAAACCCCCMLCFAQVGNQQGVVGGTALGGMQFVMFGSYAIALFYGKSCSSGACRSRH